MEQKKPRLRLARAEYNALRQSVLERDGWHCQLCGSSVDLQVHHLRSRGRLGDDKLGNLIALCALCHRQQHEAVS
jgi:5-methylcytosine-specific restriction endonuclease McrA